MNIHSTIVVFLGSCCAVIACSGSGTGGQAADDGGSSSGGSAGSGGGPVGTDSPPDCPGIPTRFGGPQPEGAVICSTDKKSVEICKNGQWQSAGVSCADSTSVDSAGVVHACQCSTNYPLWSARCWYENKDCLYVYAGSGTPCQGQPAEPVCGGGNWLYYCDGKGGAKSNIYCRYGCAAGTPAHCAGNDPCVNALNEGHYCGSTLTTPTTSPLFQSVTANAGTLYTCSGYATQSAMPCPNGCQAGPNKTGDDACK